MSETGGTAQDKPRVTFWDFMAGLRGGRRLQTAATLGLVVLAPVLAFSTFLVLGPLDQSPSAVLLRVVLLLDLVYVLTLVTLVLYRMAQMIAASRARSAGSRLHLRLVRVFAFLALAPTVTVAIFAGLTINIGLEGWFSTRVRSVVSNSLAAAQAYENEHRRDLVTDARALGNALDRAGRRSPLLGDGQLRELLAQGQSQIQRGLREAFIIDGDGNIKARGERSYLFDYTKPTQAQIQQARDKGLLIIEDWTNSEYRALMPLGAFLDRFLYVSRAVDGKILQLLDETKETVHLYQQLESDRGTILFEFGLLYLGFAVILILAAIWLGLWFAERLARPVGRLAGAAQRVGAGDLDVRVIEEPGDDEIAMLGRLFNQMTRQLKGQRAALLENTRAIEERRRLFDSVLGSVTAGVVGLDNDGVLTFVNRSAARLLAIPPTEDHGQALSAVAPEFCVLFDRLRTTGAEASQEQIAVLRNGVQEQLLVRMATRRSADGELEGYVVAFDDVTDLVSAQRMAAWGDVARRIAHEIKNPLTPIRLSAERIRRKFDADGIDQYTDVIIRQTTDLSRIVDEFSKFARMPAPQRRREDIVHILRDAVTLQQVAFPAITFTSELPDPPVEADIDATMISQAVINIIKNGAESIESLIEQQGLTDYRGEVRVALEVGENRLKITVADNGTGLPQDRARLFEPYVTTRSKGTGLGLSIVRKIAEEHGGALTLGDAPVFEGAAHAGALATMTLPRPVTASTGDQPRAAE